MDRFDSGSTWVVRENSIERFEHDGVVLRITEVEAYLGAADPAAGEGPCHQRVNGVIEVIGPQQQEFHQRLPRVCD